MEAVPDEDAEERANVKLAFGPDVEKAGAKPQRNAKPQKDVRRRGDQGIGKRVRIDKRALEQGIKRLQWIGAAEGDRQAGHDEPGDDRDHWKQDGRGDSARTLAHGRMPKPPRPSSGRSFHARRLCPPASRRSGRGTSRPLDRTVTGPRPAER